MSDDLADLRAKVESLQQSVEVNEAILDRAMLTLSIIVHGLANYSNVVAGNFLARTNNSYGIEAAQTIQPLIDAIDNLARVVEQARAK